MPRSANWFICSVPKRKKQGKNSCALIISQISDTLLIGSSISFSIFLTNDSVSCLSSPTIFHFHFHFPFIKPKSTLDGYKLNQKLRFFSDLGQMKEALFNIGNYWFDFIIHDLHFCHPFRLFWTLVSHEIQCIQSLTQGSWFYQAITPFLTAAPNTLIT